MAGQLPKKTCRTPAWSTWPETNVTLSLTVPEPGAQNSFKVLLTFMMIFITLRVTNLNTGYN